MNFSYISTGNLILSSNLIYEIDYDYYLHGNLSIQGEALYDLTMIDLIVGDVKLDPYFSSLVNYSFIFELNSSWNVEKTIEYDLDFTWDVGNQSLYWYTVEGICKVNSGCHTTGIPSGHTGRIYSRTVAAKNLVDLCFKLNSLNLNYPIDWPVTKIIRYKKPVYIDTIKYVDDLNNYNLLENNSIVKTTNNSSETYINDDVVSTVEYFDKYTILLPDYRKVVKLFKDGILIKVEIVEIDGSVKTYNENTVAIIKAIPSSLISINYKIAKQIKSLDINDNSGVLQEYCHIPECLSLCVNEDLMVNIGCVTSFTDGFYDYTASGAINLTGQAIYDNVNNINFNGGLTLSGSSISLVNNYNYLSSGLLTLGSSPLITSIIWKYSSLNNSLIISGNSICIGKNLHYISRGSLVLSGALKDKLSLKFLIKNPKLILSIKSDYSYVKNFKYTFNGSFSLQSNFTFNSNAYTFGVNSGLILTNNFLVKSNRRNYQMDYGFVISGITSIGQLLTLGYGNFGSENSIILAGLSTHETELNVTSSLLGLRYITTGSVVLSGNSNASLRLHHYTSNGGLLLGSQSLIKSTNFTYSSSGSLFLSGSSDTNIINDLNLIVNIGCQTSLIAYEPILPEIYGNASGDTSFTFVNGFVANSNCGCNPIPVTLYLNNNITTFNLLKLFLNRNNLNLSNDIELHYNVVGKSWRNNVHFSSIDKLEEWNIVYEWSCDNLDSLNVWNFSILISRRVNSQSKITKFSFLFDQSDPCNNESINFNFNFNTNTNNIVYPTGLNLLKFIVKDDIGFFKDKQWQNNSLLKIKISENQNIVAYKKKDIFSIFP